MNDIVMTLENATKSFQKANSNIDIFNNININFKKGKFYAIMGESGAGKSTLINILGLMSNLTSGDYYFNNVNINKLKPSQIADLRNKEIGFVFQDFYLDNYLKAYENVLMPMILNKKIKDKKKTAYDLLEHVGLKNRAEHYPRELSGGECQRVAIARALANNPNIILADEPTGNLDKSNEHKIFETLKNISKSGKCVIVVSHSSSIKEYADVIYELKNNRLLEVK